jgi:hypothetical protein
MVRRLKCSRGVPDKPGSLPQISVHQLAVQVHCHRRSRRPEHPLDHQAQARERVRRDVLGIAEADAVDALRLGG